MVKKMILCDTDVMIDYWDTKQLRNEKTISIINNKIELNNIVISAITLNLELFTYNQKDFKFISDLNLFKF